ncbi:hypothetical protein B0H14DRAFT_3617557 [Mycena olivaceomarginata]|nr:hypothetical protein B0H14DRAFT_3617557 [Mycena olivaceomarginata]
MIDKTIVDFLGRGLPAEVAQGAVGRQRSLARWPASGGVLFVHGTQASSQGAGGVDDGERGGSCVGKGRERVGFRYFSCESADSGIVSGLQGDMAPDVVLTSRGGERCLYLPSGSGDQQASPSSSGGSAHPSQRRGKTGHCGGPEQGAPQAICLRLKVSLNVSDRLGQVAFGMLLQFQLVYGDHQRDPINNTIRMFKEEPDFKHSDSESLGPNPEDDEQTAEAVFARIDTGILQYGIKDESSNVVEFELKNRRPHMRLLPVAAYMTRDCSVSNAWTADATAQWACRSTGERGVQGSGSLLLLWRIGLPPLPTTGGAKPGAPSLKTKNGKKGKKAATQSSTVLSATLRRLARGYAEREEFVTFRGDTVTTLAVPTSKPIKLPTPCWVCIHVAAACDAKGAAGASPNHKLSHLLVQIFDSESIAEPVVADVNLKMLDTKITALGKKLEVFEERFSGLEEMFGRLESLEQLRGRELETKIMALGEMFESRFASLEAILNVEESDDIARREKQGDEAIRGFLEHRGDETAQRTGGWTLRCDSVDLFSILGRSYHGAGCAGWQFMALFTRGGLIRDLVRSSNTELGGHDLREEVERIQKLWESEVQTCIREHREK